MKILIGFNKKRKTFYLEEKKILTSLEEYLNDQKKMLNNDGAIQQ